MPSAKLTKENSSPYITAQGYLRLQQELNLIWLRRRDVTRHLAAAAAEGDRSENAEYIYRKKELREIDRRIRYLQKRLPQLKVVRTPPDNRGQVFFGARVTLENDSGEAVTYRIVGADEYDQDKGYISVDSPLAKALLKKKLDEEVRVETTKGRRRYLLVAIAYTDN
jgi:transcription elongation factor GreB